MDCPSYQSNSSLRCGGAAWALSQRTHLLNKLATLSTWSRFYYESYLPVRYNKNIIAYVPSCPH